ncbi:DUF397 domain-containing protein [Nocardiopsis alba]|uniref:DUF397 domain-containing protein n=1 Tax=Nocardiopsis alba TaxID=53437 RepID=UPI00366F6E30
MGPTSACITNTDRERHGRTVKTESLHWHTSTYSGARGDCVEVAEGQSTCVRDTRNREHGTLTFSAPEWTALLSTLAAR